MVAFLPAYKRGMLIASYAVCRAVRKEWWQFLYPKSPLLCCNHYDVISLAVMVTNNVLAVWKRDGLRSAFRWAPTTAACDRHAEGRSGTGLVECDCHVTLAPCGIGMVCPFYLPAILTGLAS